MKLESKQTCTFIDVPGTHDSNDIIVSSSSPLAVQTKFEKYFAIKLQNHSVLNVKLKFLTFKCIFRRVTYFEVNNFCLERRHAKGHILWQPTISRRLKMHPNFRPESTFRQKERQIGRGGKKSERGISSSSNWDWVWTKENESRSGSNRLVFESGFKDKKKW